MSTTKPICGSIGASPDDTLTTIFALLGIGSTGYAIYKGLVQFAEMSKKTNSSAPFSA